MALDKITSDSLATGAVNLSALPDGVINTSKIANLAVTAEKLHATLDLSGKTLTLPDGVALPSQTSHSGKYLTTDGSNASWATIPLPSQILPPTNITPSNNSTNIQPSSFVASTYYSLYGYAHSKSQWQVSTDSSFSSTLIDTGDVDSLTSLSTVVTTFANSTTYYWRVRYKDSAGNYSEWSTPTQFQTASSFTYNVEYLLVAGGGAGQVSPWGGGGGGGGGVLYNTSSTLTIGTSYSVVVGAGGTSSGNGNNSTFNGGVAFGSGGGSAGNGGSGGGGGHSGQSSQYGTATQTSNAGGTGYGNNGGTNYYGGSYPCGSGGGAGGAGGQMANGGAGMNFVNFSSFGASGYFAGGGGAADNNGNATSGGSGGGASAHGGTGSANTGGGGGGGKNGGSGAGGSGVFILRYLGSQRGTGGSVTSAGGYTYHAFTSSNTFIA